MKRPAELSPHASRRFAMCLAVACLAACASGGGSSLPLNEDPVPGAEIVGYTNIHLALEQLRPRWVRRAREVFVDNEYAGSVAILRRSFNERVRYIELVPAGEVVRRFGSCQAPPGTGVSVDQPRDPQCGTRPIIHIVLFSRDSQQAPTGSD